MANFLSGSPNMMEMCRRDDRRVFKAFVENRYHVRVMDRCSERLASVTRRAWIGYLVPYTVPLESYYELSDENGSWYVSHRSWVSGETPVTHNSLWHVLEQLHSERETIHATREMLEKFYYERVIERVVANCPEHRELIESGLPWKRLLSSYRAVIWGPWHGDATIHNAVETPGGRIVLIDHAAEDQGPQEYDYAKLVASLLIEGHNDWLTPEILWQEYWTYADIVMVVVAGMIGNHCSGGRNPGLVDLMKRLADVCKKDYVA